MNMRTHKEITARFQAARRDPSLAVLEGFHALKHALRFGARVLDIVADESTPLDEMARSLAPDLAEQIATATPVPGAVIATLAPHAPATGTIALALRPAVDLEAVLRDARLAPVVLLDRPRSLGNLGATVRVAAAADAAALVTTGDADPWHPTALRGAAGLHFALPVTRADPPPDTDRPLVAIDPEGDVLRPEAIPPRAILAFGSERHGLGDDLLSVADRRLRIPMRAGVSSLNLATAVAVVLYTGLRVPRL